MNQLIAVFFISSDDYTYSNEYLHGIYDDIDKAKTLAKKLISDYYDPNPTRKYKLYNFRYEWSDMELYAISIDDEGHERKQNGCIIRLEFIELNKERN